MELLSLLSQLLPNKFFENLEIYFLIHIELIQTYLLAIHQDETNLTQTVYQILYFYFFYIHILQKIHLLSTLYSNHFYIHHNFFFFYQNTIPKYCIVLKY